MKFGKILLSALSVFSVSACASTGENIIPDDDKPTTIKYTNPIIYADCPDPSVVRDGDDIYIFGTMGRTYKYNHEANAYDQLPDIRRTESWGPSAVNIWAPDVYKIGDTWNYYYSNSAWGTEDTCGIGVMTSKSLEGPWEDKGKIFDSQEIGVMNSIDPCVVEDNGKIWIVWGSFRGLFMIELNEDGTKLKNPSTAKDDKILVAGVVGSWNGATYEGAYIRKIKDYYYFFGSQGTCCAGANSTYHVKVARSKSITGPYVDSKGIDMCGTNRGELVIKGNQDVAGPGHMSLLEDDAGDWWMFYHGFDKLNPGQGRVVFMDKLNWDDNGFPYVISHKPTFGKELKGPKFNWSK